MNTPVLLLTYRRSDFVRNQLKLLLEEIKVKSLFVFIDGPQANEIDRQKVLQVRNTVTEFVRKFPKQIKVLQAEENQGCQKGVEMGIDWFFSKVDAGIILEDDCVPHPDFFPYCAELLLKYQDDSRVGMISGTKPVLDVETSDSYFFSHQSIVWGWATWKHKWMAYHQVKAQAPSLLERSEIRQGLLRFISQGHLKIMDRVVAGSVDTWDFIWYLTNLIEARFCILPQKNLISNVGFAADATHTKIKTTQSRLPVSQLQFPLRHPSVFLANPGLERKYLQQLARWRLALSILTAYVLPGR